MKKIFLPLLAVLILATGTILYAQGSGTSGARYQYCEFDFSITTKGSNTERKGTIWYGNGKSETYNEFYAGLNYLGANSWELCATYVNNWDNSGLMNDYGSRYLYTFKKRL